jgi:SAM-dependent methyltransferase
MPTPPLPRQEQDDHLIARWLRALEERHLANLRFAEVTRALRALSIAYVERRGEGKPRGALDSAGKRAAFALFYAPLHFIATTEVVRLLGADAPPPRRILDIGCGTGVAGAAWARTCSTPPEIVGLDRHPWAIEESRWTYAQFELHGRAHAKDVSARLPLGQGDAVIAAYVLNELSDATRRGLEQAFVSAGNQGARVLVLEPISRQAAPWWEETAKTLAAHGFRADEWRLEIERPAIVRKFDEASGLNHRRITLRTLYHPGSSPGA